MTKTSGPVLVVDDDADVRLLAQRAIHQAGHEAVTARDGNEALRLLIGEGLRPSLVILDQSMPGRDGLSVLRALRATPDHAALPVVMFITRLAAEFREVAAAAGADDSVAKPAEVGQFQAAVHGMLRRWVEPAVS